ncbi:MAG: SprT family zinc-dependent metalloprotease [Candidatus Hadarchaeales archaeon]
MRRSSTDSRPLHKVLRIEGESIPYTVEWRKVKYPRLELKTGKLKIILPKGVKDETPILERNLQWILKRHEEIKRAKENIANSLSGNGILIFGSFYKVEPGIPLVIFLNGIQKKFDLMKERDQVKLRNFLKKILREELRKLVNHYSSKFGLRFGRIYIRNQKTKWASCSSSGNLSFNFRLVHVPYDILKYVVCHEVLHLAEKGHSKKFWEKIREEFPNYKEMEKKLFEYWFFTMDSQFPDIRFIGKRKTSRNLE